MSLPANGGIDRLARCWRVSGEIFGGFAGILPMSDRLTLYQAASCTLSEPLLFWRLMYSVTFLTGSGRQ